MSSIVLFDPELVIARLQSQVAALRDVAGAADLAAASQNLIRAPAAFVLPLSDRPGRNTTGTMVVSQQNTMSFGVVFAVQNLRDVRGQKGNVDLLALRISAMTALLGWQPALDYDPCEYGAGRLLQLTDQVLWWQDDYLTRALLRSV